MQLRLHPSNSLDILEFFEKVFIFIFLSFNELPQITLFVGEQFEIQSFYSADKFNFRLEIKGNFLLFFTENFDKVDNLIQNYST